MNSTADMQPEGGQPRVPQTAGQMLRAAREARGLHLAVISVNLKVSVRQLEALEADQYDAFKGAAFVRALALSVCRQLKLDSAPVLALLPQAQAPKMLEPAAIGVQATPVTVKSRPSGGKGLSRQVVLISSVMLLGAGALLWWPTQATDESAAAESAPSVSMGESKNPEVTVETPAMPEASASTLAAPLPAAAASTPQTVTPAPAVLPKASEIPAASSPLVLRLAEEAWVTVRDNKGQTVFKRMVKANETVTLDLEAPLFVYLGRAEGSRVLWQGKPLDLVPYTQNNEVRISIKP